MNEDKSKLFPSISVVIPVRNEEKYIRQTIQYLLNQDYPHNKLEIIIVDGQSEDSTADIVKETAVSCPAVKLLENPSRLSSAARNIGAKNAKGDIITFIDGHVYIDNDQLLKNTALLMSEKGVSVLSRPQFLDTPDNNQFQKAVALARKSVFGHGLDSTIYLKEEKYVQPDSSGATYKKAVFEKVGYFDENFDAAEDWEFNYRVGKAGFKSFSSLKLAVYYFPRDSLRGLFNQMKRYGIGRFRFLKKHHRGLSSGVLAPVFFLSGLCILAILSVFSKHLFYLFLIYCGLYLVMNLFFSIITALTSDFRSLFHLPAIYFFIHIGLAWGFIREVFCFLFKRGS